ncbi:hypothetical protein V6N13_098868 [Hibiscus sabdariffa]|uniref:NAC domain-containing protein n=1 Tax=Hibiscus sabdariffa TaxID=183260 RepID=A0ABR2EF66_9ROSI
MGMERVNHVSLANSMSMEEGDAAVLRSLPSGYRFKPRDEELVDFYLKRKIQNKKLPPNIFRDVHLYNYDPDTLTAMNNNASSNGVTTEWFFFTPRERKYANGMRPRRCAGHGFWKASGKDKEVFSKGEKIGLRKTLVFYKGKSFKGDKTKTDWRMHEYVLIKAPERQRLGKEDMRLDDWVLCKVYKKLNKDKRSSGKGAIVVHNEDGVLQNENSPVDPSNSLMPPQNPAISYPQEAVTPASLPLVPLDLHSQTRIPLQQPLSSVGPNHRSHLPRMQPFDAMPEQNSASLPLLPLDQQSHPRVLLQQPLSGVGPSNQCHLLSTQQQWFSNICPCNRSYLPRMLPEPFDAMPGQNPASLPSVHLDQQSQPRILLRQPLSSVGPSNQSHLWPTQHQKFSNVCPSNLSHLPLMQQQPFDAMLEQYPASLPPVPLDQQSQPRILLLQPLSSVGPSNRSHLSTQQHQFSNVCPSNQSHLPQMQPQPFDAMAEQNPAVFCNYIPTHVPLPPVPLNQQSWSQAPVQQSFSCVGPSNVSQLPRTQK